MLISCGARTPTVNVTVGAVQTRIYFNAALTRLLKADRSFRKRLERVQLERRGAELQFKFTTSDTDGFSLFREGRALGLTTVVTSNKIRFLKAGKYAARTGNALVGISYKKPLQ